MLNKLALAAALALCAATAAAVPAIGPRWSDAQMDAVLSRTQRLRLAPDLTALTPGEHAAVRELLAAGEQLNHIYMQQRHPQAIAAADYLARHAELTKQRDLFWMNIGPVATTLDNTREPFLSVEAETPAKNMYPPGTTQAVMDAFLTAHPERRADILDERTVVWTANATNLRRALAVLDAHPALETLHPGLRARLRAQQTYLSVPYSVAYADDLFFVADRMNAAADDVADVDAAFARYLRLRARDLLADDYEGGDAAWVTGRFTGHLNAQIGAYETYDDSLYGVKTFFALSLLVRDVPRSTELSGALEDIQRVEDALPYEHHRRVRSDIPVGVYNIVADFGQARGTNTATILPNEAYLAQQYGRTILMRGNILLNDEIFGETERAFSAAVVDEQAHDLTSEGGFYRTLWHEIGHYCGVAVTSDGRDLDSALQDSADLYEEMKADLVSLTSARILHDRGRLTDAQLRAIYASGIRRVLQKNQPRRDQPYQTMQLMQWNWFLDKGALSFENGRLRIHYDRYPAAIQSLLREVLAIQYNGDRNAANAFVTRWTQWRPDLHEVIAQRMRQAERTRFSLVTYAALDAAH